MAAKDKGAAPLNDRVSVLVCQGTGCSSSKSERIRLALEEEVKKSHLDNVSVELAGCHGFCQEGPTVIINPEGVFYTHVKPEDATEIVQSHLVQGKPVDRLLYRDPVTKEARATLDKIDFFRKQTRLVLHNCGYINPEKIEDYIAAGGYEALRKALRDMTPEQVIEEVKRSGLRGRGGGGFSAGQKWEVCRRSPGNEKYVICNDRNILEGDPHTLIEGIIIAAYAVGAAEGFISFRTKSPLGFKRMAAAIEQAKEHNFLGKNILGTGFSFELQLRQGMEDFVAGEETALIASIEGERGMPRPKPPYPAQSGLWGKPTIVHNVKTFATVPIIIRNGAKWFAGFGTEKSKGTAIFALTGKVANNGLVEVPLNMTLRELVFGIGGGIPGGKRLKAVHTGGPSGGFLPPSLLDSPVDFDTLETAGSIMGSGAVVVLDEDSCIVDTTKFFLSSTQLDSCGKCVQCRLGLKQMVDIMEDITHGRGQLSDIDLLVELGEAIKAGSLCGLGKTAPNPILTSIKYFREEYIEHIKKAHCSAAVCKGLVKAPCSHTCPAGVDVPRYLRLIAQKRYDDAVAVIRERIPFPSVCGYICIHVCETKCRRRQLDEPIAIRALKRFAADHARKDALPKGKIAPASGKKVAVVGAGPAGLTAAYYLAKLGGHAVTVFEALPEAGGMMLVGIPRYRLPKEILDSEIEEIKKVGVEIKTNTRVDSIDALRAQGFDAVFLGVGAHAGSKMRVTGEESQGVMDCVTFLRDVSLGKEVKIGNRVAVIGGGNAAIDCSRTSLRLGAKDVDIIYRRTRDEMPAAEEEIEEALKEGVKIEYLMAPNKISRQNGHLDLECIRMQLGAEDASGRKRPEPVKGSEFSREYDTVIAAIGQRSDIPNSFGLALNKDGTIRVDPDTLATSRPDTFSGGDVVSGPASVIEAIAAGRQAAVSIDKYLGGKGLLEEKLLPPEEINAQPESDDEPKSEGRPKNPELPLSKRLNSFELVELGLPRAKAIKEAERCLKCDLEKEEE
ncbi:MAG: FAD-dependent oxidoreductase [Chloroflexi bacterium]|nr:FAD-dependent oxidoreductase [Chloroflexota bacterium]